MTVYNHLLFSEIFFRQIRRETADLENLRATLSTIRDTWQYYMPPPAGAGRPWTPAAPIHPDDVAQLRSKVVEQILAYLETTYGPCEADSRAFFLYGDWAKEDRSGLCLVLPYSAHIEGRDAATGMIPKGRNYALQLLRLLRQHNLDWGVLTNSRQWRLFHRKELSPTDSFIHVDLEEIILTDNIQDYIVFHRFFNRAAFAREGGRQRLDQYKEQSDKATEIIEDHLSAHVEEIARQLCQGLVESCREAGEDVTAPETRKEIYKNALFLVYRLLFVLYAEARGLLPLDNDAYREVCLEELLVRIRENHRLGLRYADAYAIWGHLQALFALIDQGKPMAGVPAYNGGLFDPGRRPFLTRHRIRNDYLQSALIRLCTIPARGKSYDQDREPQPIDYRDLSVRHLGSLYEGLLEYNLFVVEDEPRVVRTNQKRTQYLAYSAAGKVRAGETVLQIGDVYFSETAGERKATGSYYTPEDVVDYIVRNTVGEKLAELKAEFYAQQRIERQLADLADTPPDVPAHRQIQEAIDDQFLGFVRDKVLHLKILDPAMGSGHFLVNATHAVANFIVDVLNETPWENPEIDTDVATWKRRVAERCIFGVDLNELAVELAKLCLWMTTTAKGKPLTFLDHHLRWGNSLVGAWTGDIGVYPLAKRESRRAFTLPLERFQLQLGEILAGYSRIYARSSDDVDEVREKSRIFEEEVYPKLQPYRELLDLHTGVLFGCSVDESTYARLGAAVLDAGSWSTLRTPLMNLLAHCRSNHWFHWELEFPEAFCSVDKGFSIVLGNPPYAGYPDEAFGRFARESYKAYECGDVYALFLERALNLVRRPSGSLGFIVPLSITFSNRLASLRAMLLQENLSWRICSFDKRPQSLFPKVQQRTSIVVGGLVQSGLHFASGPLLRWLPNERPQLFDRLQSFECTDLILDLGIPKIGSDLQVDVLRRLLLLGSRVEDSILRTKRRQELPQMELENRTVYFFGVAYRWLVVTKALPSSVTPSGHPVNLTGFKPMLFGSEELAWQHVAILNSSFAFWFWLLYGDSFHVTRRLLTGIPLAIGAVRQECRSRLSELAHELQKEMSKHVFFSVMMGQTTANFNMLKCRHITSKIDLLLCEELGLSQLALRDIQNFCDRAAGLSAAEPDDSD